MKQSIQPRSPDDPVALRNLLDDEDEDELHADAPLTTPPTQIPTLITFDDLRKAQESCEECKKVIADLKKEADGEKVPNQPSKHWEITNGVLCRLTEANRDGHDSLRPMVPEHMRKGHKTMLTPFDKHKRETKNQNLQQRRENDDQPSRLYQRRRQGHEQSHRA